MLGQRLGHFRIQELLGEGGMGAVYRATDERLGRDVAIKVLPAEFAASPERLARFEREAQVIAGLNHPNICALYDVGSTADGEDANATEVPVHYLVMELVEGESLQSRMERGLGAEQAVSIAVQIAEALEAAHARGIVHRDLKPANVMLTVGGPSGVGQVKVLDFGLAKSWDGPAEASPQLTNSPTLTAQMTQAGVIMGTAAYMSPEQARGEEADQRADIWAWGVILYEMLTGTGLFAEPTVSDTLAAVLRADFEWDRLPADTSPSARRTLTRALERDAARRWHAIADARIELTSATPDASDTGAQPTGARAALWATGAVAVVVTLVAIAGWSARAGNQPAPVTIAEVARGEDMRNATLSPDGRRVVIERASRLFVRELDAVGETPLANVSDAETLMTLFWSADGRTVGYTSPSAIYTVGVGGGAPLLVCDIPDSIRSMGVVLGATWWDDERIVFSLDARGLWVVDAGGGQPELLLAPRRDENELALHFPSLLPDGATLLAKVRRNGPDDVYTFLRDGERTDLRLEGWELGPAVVTASGHLVFIRNGIGGDDRDAGIWAARFSSEALLLLGDPVRLLSGRFTGVSVASNGNLLTLSQEEGQNRMVALDRDGEVLRPFGQLAYGRDPAASPDGEQLAIWGVDVFDGTRTVRVTPSWGTGPTWSPDGEELIFDGGRDEGLWRVPADGSRDPEQLLDMGIDTPHWSPDGRHVLFTRYHELEGELPAREVALGRIFQTDVEVYALGSGDGPRPFRDSPASEMHARFSPDGRFVAYASNASGRFEVYVTPFPAGDRRWQVSIDGGRFPRWRRDGGEITFVDDGVLLGASFRSAPGIEIGAPERLISSLERPLSFYGFGQSNYDTMPGDGFVAMAFSVDPRQGALLVQNWVGLLQGAR